MSFHSFSLIPELNNDIFSDRFKEIDKMFSTITGQKPISTIPNYDLIQKDDNHYQLIISIPGYHENELDIAVHKNQLSITGKKTVNTIINNDTDKKKILHKGLPPNNFSIHFNLNYRIQVNQAELKLGLLNIDFQYHIPEEEKPKKIIIQNQEQKTIEKNKN
ncbi:Small heat shock protein Ibp [Buchnera aphidicola (Eriosoma lanigerum)]|uniref:Hsp20 family protein n=1 Tax=Buchnera aphidicola TaxID=9 RepID=UPI003464C256